VLRRADDLIDYLGRDDDQIKIDGHRIEPGEIEREIALISGVRDCRVLVVKGPQGQKRLAAYVIADATTQGLDLRQLLGSKLPPFMVPHHVLFLDSLPINANGKLDRSALPDPFRPIEDVTAGASGGAATVAGWWERILGRRVPSIDTSFFDAGGTSLEAVRLFELIERELGREIEPTFVFRYATIRRQADAIATLASNDAPAGGRGQLRRAALAQRQRGRAA
jgi:acyl carrier protein